ncbi:MAG: tRNA (adenosine(37)-N6)-threonylcarbamoyltransferase complex ATPase subunit type 1 TsaE [Cytophagia bacterium]|nr:tRNA (adenosine(37)-N6)-threonylcarbamoyltransferase complex ATPase subunit type 1 TsaE [Cytophagia bacterium]
MLDRVFGLSDLDGVAQALLDHAHRRRIGSLPVVLALIGEMGAGKTTLFRAMGTCLGCDPLPTSPTYSLIQEYRTEEGGVVLHADLYRLRGPEEWLALDPAHFLNQADWVWLEWPERAGPALPEQTLFYKLETFGTSPEVLEGERLPAEYENRRRLTSVDGPAPL